VEWNLRTCARAGHATYAPVEDDLRQRLVADTAQGRAWRCLRCGAYVIGDPTNTGPADMAPVLLRGRALRSAFIMRLLAIERFARGALLVVLGAAVLQFRSNQASVRDVINQDLGAAKPLFDQLGWNASDSGLIHSVESMLNARHSTLTLVALFVLGYGLLQLAEGVGLWTLRRWGEYFAVVATSLFLPLELYELHERVTLLRVFVLIVNVAAVVYLLVAKRLFGLRGGRAAYEAERHEESLLEVERSAMQSDDGGSLAPAPGR
jgi:uncharacterized membrane protein (DUF2068 family)